MFPLIVLCSTFNVTLSTVKKSPPLVAAIPPPKSAVFTSIVEAFTSNWPTPSMVFVTKIAPP